MRTWIERYEMACRHVLAGRHLIERQRALIDALRSRGADTRDPQNLLRTFEQSQAIFEADLERLSRGRDSGGG
jgi:hypothetical protein